LLRHFCMVPARKGSSTYVGIGRDGRLRRCYFHYHAEGVQVATGTAAAIARQLGFSSTQAMKVYVDSL